MFSALLKVALSLTSAHQRHLAEKPYDPVTDPLAAIEASLQAIAETLDKFVIATTVASLRSLRARAPQAPWAVECVRFLEEIAALRRWKDEDLFACFLETLKLRSLSEVPLPFPININFS